MHDLLYMMYNLKVKNKQIRIVVALPFDVILSMMIIGYVVEIEKAQGEYDGGNVD